MTAQPQSRYTLDEYFELEKSSEARYEYFDGDVFNMSGVQPIHARLEGRLFRYLDSHAEKKECHVFPANLRVIVPSLPPYRYPDLTALCGKPKFEEVRGLQCLANPNLIVEILSPSTEAFDRGEKFKHYKSISSFREYLLISQNSKDITHYLKQTKKFWRQSEYSEGESLKIETLDCELNVDELYNGINFDSETGF